MTCEAWQVVDNRFIARRIGVLAAGDQAAVAAEFHNFMPVSQE